MATIKIRWVVAELENALTQFDVQKIYRSTTGESGPYVEITIPATRIPLVVDQTDYYYDDTVGDPDYWYRISFYHTTEFTESELSDPIQGRDSGRYITVQDVRDAGITVAQADDAAVSEAILKWSRFMDQACRQWFNIRALDIRIDGTGTRSLHLMIPIVELDELYMNGDFDSAVDSEDYVVYDNLGVGLSDDRRNPRIALADLGEQDLFRRTIRKDLFEEGKKNQRVVGRFGFVESDGTTPLLIQRAVLKLTVNELSAADPINPSPSPAGPVISETTDGHTIRYATTTGGRKIGTVGLTGDAEVETIIQLYKGPKVMAVCA